MVDKTLSELISDVQKMLYQQAGIGVQVYSQDNIAQKIQQSFDFIFRHRRWKRFNTYLEVTLDGTTGRANAPITVIKSFDDIYKIYREDSDQPLTAFSSERNPYNVTGGTAYQYMADSVNLFRVVPFTATGGLVIFGRAYPQDTAFILSDIVPFDYLAVVNCAAWMYCADDASNAAQADKFQGLFEERIRQLYSDQSSEPIALNPDRVDIPDRWHDA
jgi:hypothetical protein